MRSKGLLGQSFSLYLIRPKGMSFLYMNQIIEDRCNSIKIEMIPYKMKRNRIIEYLSEEMKTNGYHSYRGFVFDNATKMFNIE